MIFNNKFLIILIKIHYKFRNYRILVKKVIIDKILNGGSKC